MSRGLGDVYKRQDYSVNQFRIIPPDIDLDQITHGSRKNPNTISVEKVLNKIRKFI